jgi:membrane-bound lytic murein transglycosylase B
MRLSPDKSFSCGSWLKHFRASSVKCLALSLILVIASFADPSAAAQKKKVNKKKSSQTSFRTPTFNFVDKPEVQQFAGYMAEKHNVPVDEFMQIISQAAHKPEVVRLMTPGTGTFKRSWQTYRSRYLDELRIREGINFWRTHQQALARAEQQFGVPAAYIVSIIGVETVYGRVTGNFRVIDALATLAFDYPRRGEFFRDELEQYLLLAKAQGWNPLVPKGSFAGAIGLPQFMPGSIRRHAIDFDGDSKIDLANNPVDAIGSVANFFVNHGWQRGKNSYYPANIAEGTALEPWLEGGIKPRFSVEQLAQAGIRAAVMSSASADALALIELPTPNEPTQYVLATQNFYTITRYNQSSFYAMAVIELAQALEKAAQLQGIINSAAAVTLPLAGENTGR